MEVSDFKFLSEDFDKNFGTILLRPEKNNKQLKKGKMSESI